MQNNLSEAEAQRYLRFVSRTAKAREIAQGARPSWILTVVVIAAAAAASAFVAERVSFSAMPNLVGALVGGFVGVTVELFHLRRRLDALCTLLAAQDDR